MIKKIILVLLFISIYELVFATGNEQIGDSLSTIEFSFVGDIMCHSTQYNYSQVEEDSFDFKPVFREIKSYFDNSDVVVGNLETVIEVEGVKFAGYPIFNTPKEFLEGLKFAGFDILSTANNHSFDIKERGVRSTIEHIKYFNMQSVGTYITQSNRDSVIIFQQKGIKFAILSYTFGVNLYEIPGEKNYLVNRINDDLIKNDISNHRKEGADLIILFFHFGSEYANEPDAYQKDVVKNSIEFGADIIIGAHPHTIQPIEYFKSENGNIDSGFVAYSLGNFVSNQRWRYSDGGAVLNFTIQKNTLNGNISLAGVRYFPIWVYKGNTDNGLEYIVLPSETGLNKDIPNYLSDEDLNLLQECYFDTKNILTSIAQNIELDTIEKSRLRRNNREYFANKIFIEKIPIMKNEIGRINKYVGLLEFIEADSTLSRK
jgi:poly-gamma-glutamate capsule biosynthesis protein CapA/YwtB (metallophosphatase superfamily)